MWHQISFGLVENDWPQHFSRMGNYILLLSWLLKFSHQVRLTQPGTVRPSSNSTHVVVSWNTGSSTGKNDVLKSTGARKLYSKFIAHSTKAIRYNLLFYQVLAARSVKFLLISSCNRDCQKSQESHVTSTGLVFTRAVRQHGSKGNEDKHRVCPRSPCSHDDQLIP